MKKQNYQAFVFFSAGPVGDHAMILEFANRFFESTGKPSYILSKHPNPFLRELVLPYEGHVTEIGVKGKKGYLELLTLIIKSIVIPHCYVLVFAIPHPTYLKVFSFFIRFFTRSRMVGLTSLCGFKSVKGPQESATFLGKGNYLSAHVDKNLFYEQADNVLAFLGYKKIDHPPKLIFSPQEEVFEKYNLEKNKYVVFHLVASSVDKSLPADRWNMIIKEVHTRHPEYKLVFSGALSDWNFIKECIIGIPEEVIVNLCGKVRMRELLTVYTSAKVNVTVHTGNAMLINMLHLPTIIVNIKGVYMFKYHFNKNAIDFTATKGCTCNPLERDCTLIPYKDKEYMACLFNNNDVEIVEAISKKIVA